MKKFKHLTLTQRVQLESLLQAKVHKKEIAQLLGVHISTIYREVKRGEYMHQFRQGHRTFGAARYTYYEKRYSCNKGQEDYEEKEHHKGVAVKMQNDHAFFQYVHIKICKLHYSPKAVLGEIKNNNIQFSNTICTNTLYSYIRRGFIPYVSLKNLPMRSRAKKRNKKIVIKRAPRGTSIEQRPIEVLQRKTFGHWEMDCVCGSTRACFLVLTERLTRKEIIRYMPAQTASNVVSELNKLERFYGDKFKKIFKSITVDNGVEFSDCAGLERSIFGKGKSQRTKLYYCHPYCSSERGSNERLNREIRRLVPKGRDLSGYTVDDVAKIEEWVNTYPREVLDFKTSEDLFTGYLRNVA